MAVGNMAGAGAVRLVMLGPPGAGKGTQGERLARERRIPRISTGDILREAVQGGTDVGRAAKATMNAGRLVSDDVVIGIVRERLARPDAERGFVLDGFPRTLTQAETLDDMVDPRAPLIVVDIEVPEDALVSRLSQRLICGQCGATARAGDRQCATCGGALVQRQDDQPDVIRERLRVYTRDTRLIVEYYRRRATFRSVDGDQPEQMVAADIAAAIASVAGGWP